jgi:hypothetical protein
MVRPARPGPRPPDIAGYVLHTLLGSGAYGEVWLGENRTTRRQVAVKVLRSRASLDWSLLDAETEKLAFLAADRRVVQLLDVGRDADPPFFVMEYVPRGSLSRYLEESGPLPVERAAEIFEEIALGLAHVHGKGILHCDLKPSNVLLDEELRPRLADFGQARAAEERPPARALGTMFYMAPEQADPAGIPDARWDVYGLGAILATMLTGAPPHHTDEAVASIGQRPDQAGRLARYRQIVAGGGPPRPIRGVDKALMTLLARCLATDPRDRFSTVEEIIAALRARRRARGRRPLMWLGGVGPVVLLALMAVFGARGYRQALERSSDAIRRRAFESNKFAATFIARSLEGEIRRYFEIVEQEAARPALASAFQAALATSELARLAEADPGPRGEPDEARVEAFVRSPARQALDEHLRERLRARSEKGAPRFASVFVVDARGTIVAVAYDSPAVRSKSIGRYFAWRTYFHGGPVDLPRDTPRSRIAPIDRARLSAPWESSTTRHWRVGVSVPLLAGAGPGAARPFLGVLVFSVDVGDFDFLSTAGHAGADRFAVLVDGRHGQAGGRILHHPAFTRQGTGDPQESARAGPLPLVPREVLDRARGDAPLAYEDPLGLVPGGEAYRGAWIAAAQPLALQAPGGLVVLVQERADAVTRPVELLGRGLVGEGLLALLAIAIAVPALWFVALARRESRAAAPAARARGAAAPPPAALRDRSTISENSGPGAT